ncbi:MAG: dihydrodipicolinate synthase family protein, partial [Anaerolineae bacterium]
MDRAWSGVFPAVTTKFKEDDSLDHGAMEQHFNAEIEAGVHGLVVIGSLGENGVLSAEEKQEVLRTAVSVSDRRVPVLACVAETTTAAACRFVEKAGVTGADGFMLLPAMQYVADPRETMHHLRSVAAASDRPLMIYNNPVAYRVDVTPEMFAELANEAKFVAIKESSEDIRRVTDIINLVGDRYQIFCGVDNLALEALLLGAVGWLAGLVNAFPRETVVLYELARAGRWAEALTLYRWFMPLLHLDVSTKLVQNIKLAEAMTGLGTEYVRAPRLPLAGEERKHGCRPVSL